MLNPNDLKVLNTIGLSHEIEKMIENSYEHLIFVSPYLKITDRLKAKLTEHLTHVDNCYFVYRENELHISEELWINSFPNVHSIPVRNLHAKIYVNENQCIIGSMNFYEYSQINNYELGIKLLKKGNKSNFEKIISEILMMCKNSESYSNLFNTLNIHLDFTIGKLFNKIKSINPIYKTFESTEAAYIHFCTKARQVMHFSDEELYQDKSAILRLSNIGKQRFDTLLKELKSN